MSRIPMREAIIASSAVSVVVSLCLVGAFAAGAAGSPSSAAAGNTTDTSNSPVLASSGNGTGNRALMSGSHQGVWFGLAGLPGDLLAPTVLASGLGGHGASDAASASESTSSSQSPQTPSVSPSRPPAQKPSPVREQSRSSALAAVSGKPRDIAQALAATHGWTGSQWVCLDKLWQHESMYQTTVRNPSSGAYGIPQALPASKMASAGADWRTNPVTQIMWGLGYISERYGSPCGAWSYWVRHYSY